MMKKTQLLYLIIFLVFVTSSFDIILNFNISGFTIRFTQILCIILFLYLLKDVLQEKILKMPLGWKPLIIWFLFLLMFTFNTYKPIMNLGYNLWLFFNILILFLFNVLMVDNGSATKIIKLYIYSFYLMSIVGIIEFLLGILGINFPYITQWWIIGKIPRINGFSFEPSYYATYLIIGWTFCRELLRRKVDLTSLKINLKKITLIITIAIILSTSRMGIAFIVLYEAIIFLKNLCKRNIKKIFVTIFLFAIIISFAIYSFKKYDLTFLLSGTGLNNTSSHSLNEREQFLGYTLEVFKNSPFIGMGLGGTYVQIAINRGFDINNVSIQNVASGTNIFAEVLAASGIFGFMSFIAYIFKLIYNPINLCHKIKSTTDKNILSSLDIALIMELMILQFNQNILRPYLWIHIAVLSSYYCLMKKKLGSEKNENRH